MTISVRGKDLLKKKNINLHEHMDLKYLKLLHVSTNLQGSDIDPTAIGTSDQRHLFCELSFLNAADIIYYESTPVSTTSTQEDNIELKIFSCGLTKASLESTKLFKTLSTHPVRVHGSFDIAFFVLDNSLTTYNIAYTNTTGHGTYTLTNTNGGYACRIRPLGDLLSLPAVPTPTFTNTSFSGTNPFDDIGIDAYQGITRISGAALSSGATVRFTIDQDSGTLTSQVQDGGLYYSTTKIRIPGALFANARGTTGVNDQVFTLVVDQQGAITGLVHITTEATNNSDPLPFGGGVASDYTQTTHIGNGTLTNDKFISLTFEYDKYNEPTLRV